MVGYRMSMHAISLAWPSPPALGQPALTGECGPQITEYFYTTSRIPLQHLGQGMHCYVHQLGSPGVPVYSIRYRAARQLEKCVSARPASLGDVK
jgi:hypothetical protein